MKIAKSALEEHEFPHGPGAADGWPVTLDLLTDALVLVGQHGVYCQSAGHGGEARDGHPDHQARSRSTGAKERWQSGCGS